MKLNYNFQKETDFLNPFNLARWRAGFNNVVDYDRHPDSPYRNRPVYLDDPEYRTESNFTMETRSLPPKNWDEERPERPAQTPAISIKKLG